MKKVDVFVIGAMKAGTSSFAEALKIHPEVDTGKIKEFDYFTLSTFSKTTLDQYHANFDPNKRLWCEVAPNYSKRDSFPGVPERIFEYNPKARIIFIRRNKIDRILSEAKMWNIEGAINLETQFSWHRKRRSPQWIKAHKNSIEEFRFGEFVRNPIVQTSRYNYQLSHYSSFKQIMIVDFESLVSKVSFESTMKGILNFIGVDSTVKLAYPVTHESKNAYVLTDFALFLMGISKYCNVLHWIHRFPFMKRIFFTVGLIRQRGRTWLKPDLIRELTKFFDKPENN